MTRVGSQGLSSQSVSGFSGRKGHKNPETDWDEKRWKPRRLGRPGLSSQSVSGFSGRKGPNKPETDWDDNPRKPRLVIPVRFGVFWPKRAKKHPKRTGMTSLGIPGLSSQSVSGFSGRKGPNKPETDWDDKPGNPRLVIPVRFMVFWSKKPQKTLKRTGMQSLFSKMAKICSS